MHFIHSLILLFYLLKNNKSTNIWCDIPSNPHTNRSKSLSRCNKNNITFLYLADVPVLSMNDLGRILVFKNYEILITFQFMVFTLKLHFNIQILITSTSCFNLFKDNNLAIIGLTHLQNQARLNLILDTIKTKLHFCLLPDVPVSSMNDLKRIVIFEDSGVLRIFQ